MSKMGLTFKGDSITGCNGSDAKCVQTNEMWRY